ncbi:MAG TPA: PRC-barrel domain-containing protein [Flavipsychrobacter sp.]|nr:PRC-barrel domain-containing protein [Flavipsychrobacter sp.]
MDNMKHRRLQELDRSDFDIVKGEPDIRGWDVRNSQGQKIGEVEELIVDAQQKKVRYMVVDLDDNELKLDHRKVLLPIGMAELQKDEDDVILPNVTAEHLRAIPDYDKNEINADTERKICTTLGRKMETNSMMEGEQLSNEFYKHDYYNDDNLYKHRLHEIGDQQKRQESEYEKGLKLWEMRSEGGVLPGSGGERTQRRSEINEDARMEMVRNRRKSYEEQRRSSNRMDRDRGDEGRQRDDDRYRDDERSHRRGNSIVDRLRDEGLQER